MKYFSKIILIYLKKFINNRAFHCLKFISIYRVLYLQLLFLVLTFYERIDFKCSFYGCIGWLILSFYTLLLIIGLAYSTKSSIKTGQAPFEKRSINFVKVDRENCHVTLLYRQCMWEKPEKINIIKNLIFALPSSS